MVTARLAWMVSPSRVTTPVTRPLSTSSRSTATPRRTDTPAASAALRKCTIKALPRPRMFLLRRSAISLWSQRARLLMPPQLTDSSEVTSWISLGGRKTASRYSPSSSAEISLGSMVRPDALAPGALG